jgi:type I restriction enzyme S subunit
MASGEVHQRKVKKTAERITPAGMASSNAQMIPKDSVMIALNGQGRTRGMAALLTIPATCNQSLAAVVANPEELVPLYAFHVLDSLYQYLRNLTGDDARNGLNLQLLRSISIPVPPKETQHRIAFVLETHDEVIEATRGVIGQTRTLKLALLQELLAKGLPGRHKSYRSIYRIGKVPADWSDATLGDVATVVQGIAIDPSRTPKAHSTPYLRVANVQQGTLDLSEIKEIETSEAERKNLGLRIKDVLMVEGHANIEELGRAALVPKAAEGMVFQNHLFRVRPDADRLDPRFLTTWINSPPGRRYFKIFGGTTSGLNTVGSGQIRALRLPLPDINEQHAICDVLESLDDRIRSAEEDLDQLMNVKSALSQGLLTGRIPVKGGRQ